MNHLRPTEPIALSKAERSAAQITLSAVITQQQQVWDAEDALHSSRSALCRILGVVSLDERTLSRLCNAANAEPTNTQLDEMVRELVATAPPTMH